MPINQKTSQLADVTVLTILHTVPTATNSIAASIIVCNRTAGALTFDIAVVPGGGGFQNVKNFIYFEHAIPAKETFVATIGVGLAATDEIVVKGSASGLSFTFTGPEFT